MDMNSVIKRTFIFTYVYVLCMVGTDRESICLRVTGVYDSKSSITTKKRFEAAFLKHGHGAKKRGLSPIWP